MADAIPTDGPILAEGKTKIIRAVPDDDYLAVIESKDDLTAGDGAKHDLIKGKSALSTTTTCNAFRLLQRCGLAYGLAFIRRLDRRRFLARRCTMIPYEVVVRRQALGSYLKRHPATPKGAVFPRLLVEFYRKTAGKKLPDGQPIPKDDPLMDIQGETFDLYRPDQPLAGQQPFLTGLGLDVPAESVPKMERLARQAFLCLEKAWQMLGLTLVDMKVEFGLDAKGQVMLADVIDNDAWRLLDNGSHLDKQVYRDGAELAQVTALYRRVAELTGQLGLPRQQLIIWRGSENDEVILPEARFAGPDCRILSVTCSMHKQPVKGLAELNRLLQEIPDAVVVALIGRSNGAGPTLAANVTVPVITAPLDYRDFPADIWSSLRTPSGTPVMTVLEPDNALLAGLQILAQRNPRLYSLLRLEQEERLTNFLSVG